MTGTRVARAAATGGGAPALTIGLEKRSMSHKSWKTELARLERVQRGHRDAEVKNIERLRISPHPHTEAMCRALSGLLEAFADRKVYGLVEAEILALGARARPEDIVAWIEGVGVLVLEIKSHRIDGIRSFENNIPQVAYRGHLHGDVSLIDQPKDFAYKLKGQMERLFDERDHPLPPLYFAGWLPFISPMEVAERGAEVAPERVWLSDMLDGDMLLDRLSRMKNLTREDNTDRSGLELFCDLFGTSSGLRSCRPRRPTHIATMGHQIDQREQELRRLTPEQERLAFSTQLAVGPKVIRGVAGSGKTIVLANAVASQLVGELSKQSNLELFEADDLAHKKQILVLCYNRVLSVYLRDLIRECFDERKPAADWRFPAERLHVTNIDRLAARACRRAGHHYDFRDIPSNVRGILDHLDETQLSQPSKHRDAPFKRYDLVFIDEGQDINLDWYPLIRALATEQEHGPSIVVFYDEAQNLYGVKRPGVGGQPPWRELLGAEPRTRGLKTVMTVGHRNSNRILSFSFDLLLGAFSSRDPKMAQFADLRNYETRTIPDDPLLDHPHAGQPCVEKLADRHYRVRFAVSDGPVPAVKRCENEDRLLSELVSDIRRTVSDTGHDVQPQDVLIMAPRVDTVKQIRTALKSAGIRTHSPNSPLEPSDGSKANQKSGSPVNSQSDSRSNPRAGSRFSNNPKDLPLFQSGRVTVSTIHASKGFTAHVCHVVNIQDLVQPGEVPLEVEQASRARLHVACTRASLFLTLWGTDCPLLEEALSAAEDVQHL
jgi:hypothetical protein